MRHKTAFCARCSRERVRIKGKCQACGDPLMGKSKFRNEPTRAADGKLKHSRKEARRADELILLYRAGEITELQPDPDDPKSRQPEFRLEVYGTQAVTALLEYLDGPGAIKPLEATDISLVLGKLENLMRDVRRSKTLICKYRCDYQWKDKSGALVVEDVKGGYVTPVYRLKKKLMVACQNVEIEET